MKQDIPTKFWRKWDKEFDKIKFLQKRKLFNEFLKGKPKVFKYGFYLMLNSYFEDLREYLGGKNGG